MNVDKKTGLIHDWTLICRNSAIDKDTGALSIFNIIDKLSVNRKHFEDHFQKKDQEKDFIVPADFEIITMWSKKTKDELSLETKTELLDPNGESLFRFSYNIVLKEGKVKRRNRSKIKGFKVTGEGLYTVNISIRKDEGEEYRFLSKVDIDVVLQQFDEKKPL